mgnify:FL=1|jgi:uncharacterized membrane protein YraQ (UPF0718 family)
MLIPTIIMGVLACTLLYIGYSRGAEEHISGLKIAFGTTLQILPLLICAFVVAGMAQVLIPREIVAQWVGGESGFKGILIGAVAGGLAPGGPYVSLPLAAGFLRAGASVGTMVAFLSGWALWSVGRLPMEVGILGWRFTLIRFACTIIFPPIAGLIAQFFFSGSGR